MSWARTPGEAEGEAEAAVAGPGAARPGAGAAPATGLRAAGGSAVRSTAAPAAPTAASAASADPKTMIFRHSIAGTGSASPAQSYVRT
ncbi:hypothetical protein [Thermocatellispora tengchongensis]|uniref:hypothetical protein n=1 Tax=Thermocatellispora tengchongensis TaxID=1073253 RepID=UPI0036405030